MRKTFAPLDDMLIERLFQPASDLMSHRLGFGRAAAACFCIDVASLSWIVSRAWGLSDAVAAWDAATAFLDMATLLLGLIALISLRTLFRRASSKQANPLRQVMRPHRAIVLLMLAARLAQFRSPAPADLADLAMLVCAAFALYLGACAERPPLRRGWASLAPAT
ncbi:MAG TPA: hypothetical protein DDZ81_09010 [Acetobacteraceae bacterium]|jgi:hypothetical protein|nr:hypothetical protein [Acetobacteraceae bacterium]